MLAATAANHPIAKSIPGNPKTDVSCSNASEWTCVFATAAH